MEQGRIKSQSSLVLPELMELGGAGSVQVDREERRVHQIYVSPEIVDDGPRWQSYGAEIVMVDKDQRRGEP